MIDMNGDGLPDMVWRSSSSVISIKFNRGNDFAPEVQWQVPPWQLANGASLEQSLTTGLGSNDALSFVESDGFGASAGAPYYVETGIAGCWGFEVGVGGGHTSTGSEMRFEDIDGDGAPDQVLKLGSPVLNVGSGDPTVYVRKNPAAGSASQGVNLLVSVANPLGGTINLTYARLGHVVDAANGVDMPHQQLVLAGVDVNAGAPGFERHSTSVDYSVNFVAHRASPGEPSGFYSRKDREFLGYSQVRTFQNDGKEVDRQYDNQSYERRHLLLSEITRDFSGTTPVLFRKTVRTYDTRPVTLPNTSTVIPGVAFPALTSEQTLFYDGAQTNNEGAFVKSMTLRHDYDDAGNPIRFDDFGDDAVGSDDVHYVIGYQNVPINVPGAFTFPRPNLVVACSVSVPVAPNAICSDANVLRRRSAGYSTAHGEMTNLTDTLFGGKDPATGAVRTIGSQNPSWSFTYTPTGNLKTSTDPNNYELTYTYDSVETHIASITDSFGYASQRFYNPLGDLTDTIDVNGQGEHIDYDPFGRAQQFCGPSDVISTGSTISPFSCPVQPTISFGYAIKPGGSTNTAPFFAVTRHKDLGRTNNSNSDTLDTVIFVDGLDRVRQTKKDASVDGVDGRIVSGQVKFDVVGRVFQEGFPIFEAGPPVATPTLTSFAFGRPAKTYAHDVLDRVRRIDAPDDNGKGVGTDGLPIVTTMIDYNNKLLDGQTQLTKTTQDPLGKLRTQYVSPRGDILAVSEQNRLGNSTSLTLLTTRYTYDPLSQLIQVQDASANGNLTTAAYDSLGHMVKLVSPDAGQTEWRYDVAGKLVAKETANLRKTNQLVKYTYETNRLKTVVYPTTSELVTYTYGAAAQAGAANGNIASRIANVSDESGTETRQYDALGNVSQMKKTPATQLPSIPGVTYEMDYVYDSFGRVLNMTYPDKEVVTYGYDSGGQVASVTGARKNGTQTTYVSNVTYNELEQRDRVAFGNGVTTSLAYYPDTKRLHFNVTVTPPGQRVQNLEYIYDLVGNITSLNNNLPIPAPVTPNTVIAPGPVTQTFGYDDLYQLTSAAGTYTGCACGCANHRSYTLGFQYDGLGNITRKTQNDVIIQPSGTSTTQIATTYNNPYTYGTLPHAPTGVGGETVTYDPDGNQGTTLGSFGPSRTLTWTEDDRLRSENDSGFSNTYLYDANGNRTHKRRTTLETWYVNPYYVVKNSLTESKHIILGSERIVTAVATITNRADPTTAGTNNLFYYHPDHLQSTGYVTGGDGSILQHDEYFPSGELWFQEQKNNDARNTQPYLFNAKELDETGLYYFGARYYDPKFSLWQSSDPNLPSYMNNGPNDGVFVPRNLGLYAYAWSNPLIVRDPDGRQAEAEPEFNRFEAYLQRVGAEGTNPPPGLSAREEREFRREQDAEMAVRVGTVQRGEAFIEATAMRGDPRDVGRNVNENYKQMSIVDPATDLISTPNETGGSEGQFTVRRFVSRAEAKQLKRSGVTFDPAKGSGIPTTIRNFTPKNQGHAKRMTGAAAADYQVDIDVTGLPRGPTRKTKSGLPEYPIRGNITRDRVIQVTKVPK
jgi:RHS repeat-associated protein